MKAKHIDLVLAGKKRSTLRSLTYNYPMQKPVVLSDGQREVWVQFTSWWEKDIPADLTPEIVKTEGYGGVQDLIDELKRMRHKLPKRMILYYFDVIPMEKPTDILSKVQS